jgi:hypothetical protein
VKQWHWLAIVLELAKQGANIVIDYVTHPEAMKQRKRVSPGRSGHRREG